MSRGRSLESLRSQIIGFERELDDRIGSLLLIETDILKTGTMRSKWLTTVSYSVGGHSTSFGVRFEVLKEKLEFSLLQLALENAKLVGFEESQILGYLIAATKPYDSGESEDDRRKLLEITVQNNIEDLKDFLTHSIKSRSNLNSNVSHLVHDVKMLQLELEQQNASIVTEMQRRIFMYLEQLRETSALSKINDKVVTGDYLVLRHNSRVAKEILIRSQNESNFARRALQEGIDQINLAAASRKHRVEQESQILLKDLVNATRLKIRTREEELKELRMRKIQRSRLHKKAIGDLVDACDEFNKKYDDLQAQRKDELERVGGELKRLREMVVKVEGRLLKLSSADDVDDVENLFSHNNSKLLEKNGRAIIESLEQRLKMLRHG